LYPVRCFGAQLGVAGVRGELGAVLPVESVTAEPGLSWTGAACCHRLTDGCARLIVWESGTDARQSQQKMDIEVEGKCRGLRGSRVAK
jgi:hypothetical protein